MGEAAVRAIDLATMGCTWVLDVSALDSDEADAMAHRWQRCIDLLAAPDRLRLVDEPIRVRVHAGDPGAVAEGELVTGAAEADKIAYALSREVTRAGLMRLRGQATLLHAAALADDEGRTVVLVAPSGGGKSTATRELGRHFGYVSDESVVMLPDGRIAPHPKPPSLVIDPDDRFHKEEPAPDDLGLGPTPVAPRLAALLTLARDATVTEPVIEEVGLVDQVLALLPETSSTWWLDDGLDRLARAVTVGGPPARLSYAEIDGCVDLVRQHLASAVPAEPTWEHLPPTGGQRLAVDAERVEPDAGSVDLSTVRVVRGPWSDAIACDGEVLVLQGARPLRLAGPGAAVWRCADEPQTVEQLVDGVTAALGEHPDAASIVISAVTQLLGHGVLAVA